MGCLCSKASPPNSDMVGRWETTAADGTLHKLTVAETGNIEYESSLKTANTETSSKVGLPMSGWNVEDPKADQTITGCCCGCISKTYTVRMITDDELTITNKAGVCRTLKRVTLRQNPTYGAVA